MAHVTTMESVETVSWNDDDNCADCSNVCVETMSNPFTASQQTNEKAAALLPNTPAVRLYRYGRAGQPKQRMPA